jgi:hypothetical protein
MGVNNGGETKIRRPQTQCESQPYGDCYRVAGGYGQGDVPRQQVRGSGAVCAGGAAIQSSGIGHATVGGIIRCLIEEARNQAARCRALAQLVEDQVNEARSREAQLEALLRRWEAEQRQGQEQE